MLKSDFEMHLFHMLMLKMLLFQVCCQNEIFHEYKSFCKTGRGSISDRRRKMLKSDFQMHLFHVFSCLKMLLFFMHINPSANRVRVDLGKETKDA